jgi:integrase
MPARKPSVDGRKNPLRVAGDPVPVVGPVASVAAAPPSRIAYTPREMRQMMISEFTWLEAAHGHPHPYTSALVRYAPVQGRPSTLSGDFIRDLLEVTGGGKARDFRGARDHAMIWMLTEGVRRAELVQLRLADLPVDLISTPYVRVVPLKGAGRGRGPDRAPDPRDGQGDRGGSIELARRRSSSWIASPSRRRPKCPAKRTPPCPGRPHLCTRGP